MKTHGAGAGYSKLPSCTSFQEKHMWLSPVMRQVVLFLSFYIIVYDFCRVKAGKIQEGALLLNDRIFPLLTLRQKSSNPLWDQDFNFIITQGF